MSRTGKRDDNSLIGSPGDRSFIRDTEKKSPMSGPVGVEVVKPEKLSGATEDIGAALEKRKAHRAAGNKWPAKGQPRGRRLRLAVLGLDKEILSRGDPRYLSAMRTAAAYRKHRARELCVAHGYVSAGASALLATAALALAASRFLYEKVAETGDIGLLKQAHQLADSARQNELAAWELCAREGTARKKAQSAEAGIPWLAQMDGGQKKTGRKSRAELAEQAAEDTAIRALPEVGGDLMNWVAAEANRKDVKDGVESDWRSPVQVVSGVPGDAAEPDGNAGTLHADAAGDAGHAPHADGEGQPDSEAAGTTEYHWDTDPSGDDGP